MKIKSNCQLTISVGQQIYQAIEACVSDFWDVGCTSAYSLNSGCSKMFILAFHICLKKDYFNLVYTLVLSSEQQQNPYYIKECQYVRILEYIIFSFITGGPTDDLI